MPLAYSRTGTRTSFILPTSHLLDLGNIWAVSRKHTHVSIFRAILMRMIEKVFEEVAISKARSVYRGPYQLRHAPQPVKRVTSSSRVWKMAVNVVSAILCPESK